MGSSGIPDGEGVIDRKAPPGKVIALYGALFAIGAAAALALSAFVHEAAGGQERRRAAPATTLEQKVDSIADDVRGIRDEQSNQSRDIAVIKRQLGLDGLGPPPVRAAGIGR